MFVIRLPNGNLRVPQSAIGNDGRVIADVYVEIGPDDADYARLAEQAVTPEEAERRRDRWRQDDEALRQEFLEYARLNRDAPWPDPDQGELTRGQFSASSWHWVKKASNWSTMMTGPDASPEASRSATADRSAASGAPAAPTTCPPPTVRPGPAAAVSPPRPGRPAGR
jgi:hypothetical protein